MGESTAPPPGAERGAPSLLLGQPAFARQWLGYVVSALGDQVGWIALVWLAIRLTGSASVVGPVTLAYVAPQAVSAPLIGALLDRAGRAGAMAVANAAAALLFAAIALAGGGRGGAGMTALYPLIVLTGALMPFNSAGRVALVPEIVPPNLLARANFLLQGGGQLAVLVGPALGGVLVSLLGPSPLLWADAATFGLQAVMLRTVPSAPRRVAAGAPGLAADLRSGLAFLLAQPALVWLGLLEVLFNFLYGPFEVLLPDMAKSLFGGPWAMGVMWTAFGVGATGAGLFFASRPWRLRPSRSFGVIILLWGLVALTMSRVATLPEASVVMLLGGMVYSPWTPLYTTTLQRIAPQALQARVAGAQASLIVLGMPFGAFVTGLVLTAVPGRTVFGLSGAATLALGAVVLLLPALRGLDGGGQS